MASELTGYLLQTFRRRTTSLFRVATTTSITARSCMDARLLARCGPAWNNHEQHTTLTFPRILDASDLLLWRSNFTTAMNPTYLQWFARCCTTSRTCSVLRAVKATERRRRTKCRGSHCTPSGNSTHLHFAANAMATARSNADPSSVAKRFALPRKRPCTWCVRPAHTCWWILPSHIALHHHSLRSTTVPVVDNSDIARRWLLHL